ncbi:MAG: Nif3-like dinuclear metal center hexameric protein [Clostridia bacterium]|nr:Nif3-like dinuclear metal center hexameric protein [Clostridia bacterium]
MKLNELIKKINEFCPESLQEEWDNSGLQISTGNEDIEKVLLAMEITSEVIEEAVINEVDLIITHHPLIFTELTKIDSNDVTGNFIQRLIAADINVYSCHTNFDKIFGGNNDFLGNVLGIDCTPKNDGFLRHGWYMNPENMGNLIELYSFKLDIDKRYFSFVGSLDRPISKVAICTGAGADFIKEAYEDRCDLLITGDVKYHDAQLAKELGINVLDIGHYASEKIFVDAFMSFIISSDIDEDMFVLSDLDINPFTLI